MPDRRPVLWRLLKLIAPLTGWMVLSALLGFVTIGSSIGLMATAAYIIAKAALHPSIAELQVAIVGVRFFGITRGLARYLERYVSHNATFRLLARLRVWFYQSLEPLAPARLMGYRSGDLLSRIVADIETLEHFYLRVIAPPAVASLVALLMWFFIGSYHIQLAVIVLAFLLATGVGMPLVTRRLGRGMGRRLVTVRSELNAALVDSIQGAADLLVFGQEGQQQRIRALNQEMVALQGRMARVTALRNALSGLLVTLATVSVLLGAIPLVSGQRLDGVYLAVLVLAVIASFEAVLPLPSAFQHLESSTTAARRLFEIVDAPPAVRDPEVPSSATRDYGLTVQDLRFSYDQDERPALDGVTFTLPQGQRLAIVGPSGGGKSTLVNLLLRFWDYQEGHIWLGGHELREYQAEDVRRWMAVVSQHTHLFNGTLRDNLLVACPHADESDLDRVVRDAHLHGLVEGLPDGLDTWIGEQGQRLSGGERRRLVIARALLKDAPLLILDEPTANLDTLVERDIIQSIQSLMKGRTTLLITHRLVGLEAVDDILVLRSGRIVERGRHHELLQTDSIYRRMWELQRACVLI
ncbi:MAG: thiol reductant ABC exporter subunit CydC [Ardenticatenia bacterium]|nr:thiol reductant ABC exporter subunit CydC [Ardenticatenia bacterium]